MDDDIREQAEQAAEVNALFNALKHDSDAQVGAIMGPLMGENPAFREYGDEIAGVIAPVVERVNGMDAAEKRERLGELAPEKVEELDAEDEEDEHDLPDLPNADEYDEIRMRVAPNPNGPWHIGHARMPAVIGTYKERYDGWMLCRFDDTDPETKRPDLDAYDAILDAIDYLGFEPDEVIRASDRVETYYEHARNLIDAGGAYTCSCPGDEFSDLKNNAEACPHRDKDAETVHEEFDAMVAGEYDAGEMVLRVKTDITHKNPALRDWVAFRMIDTPHPREAASEYRCWPMLDFQSGVDDHLTGVTHIIRGIDLQDSAKRQRFVYDYFDWEYPEVMHWGKVQVEGYDVAMSTSTILEKIEAGELDGWDDPRAPTIASLRRRGIRGEAIVQSMVELGTSTSNVDLALSSIYSHNRDLVDEETDRAFLVRDDPDHGGGVVERQVLGGPDTAEVPVHPEHEDRGVREIPVEGGVLLEGDDLPNHGERVWLKGFGCVQETRDTLQYVDADLDVTREEGVPIVHWVPAGDNVRTRLRTMDGDVSGYAEPGVSEYDVDDLLQFERVCFARIDSDPDGEMVAYFAHP
ncbi:MULTISPECIES: glutamate--tRNA ligase [Salinibaculum]|uniref:glutamate--tRNA ligase n=1 Tax=Salinibaculum TaxID=2732368 RepID=UPI0030CE7F5B